MERLQSSIWWKIFLFILSLTFLGLAFFVIYDTLDDFFQNDFTLTCIPIYDYIGRSSMLLVFFYVSGILGLYPLPEFCYRHPLFTWKWWQDLPLNSPILVNHNGKHPNINEPVQVSPTQECPNGLQVLPTQELPNKSIQESPSSTTNHKDLAKLETDTCCIGDHGIPAFGDGHQFKPSSSNKSIRSSKNHRREKTSDRDNKCLSDITMDYRTRDMGFYYHESMYPDLSILPPSVSHRTKSQPSVLHRRSNSRSFSVKSVPKRSNSQKVSVHCVPKVSCSQSLVQSVPKVSCSQNLVQSVPKVSCSQNIVQSVPKVSYSQNLVQNVPKVFIYPNVVFQNVPKRFSSQSASATDVTSTNLGKRNGSAGHPIFKF